MNQKGTQSIQKAITIIRFVAQNNELGVRLSQVSRKTDMHVATVRRILVILVEEGLLSYDPDSKIYHLGLELYTLGSETKHFALRDWIQNTLQKLAKETDDTVYLIARLGYDSLCIDRVEGQFPIKIMSYDIGERRPLGIGTAGLTYLSFLPDDEVERIVKANVYRYKAHNNMNVRKIKEMIKLTRQRGYNINVGNYLKGVTGIGFPIINKQKKVIAAISVAAISERMNKTRQSYIVKLLKNEIDKINKSIPI
jgi:DNA-binding IclR family transcriptional regulator